jgi:hypothetical protein
MTLQENAMSDAREPLDSRRDFFKSLSSRSTLRSLGGLMGSVVGIVTQFGQDDSCESAGLALGQNEEPFDYTYHAPLESGSDTEEGSALATNEDCRDTEGGERQD